MLLETRGERLEQIIPLIKEYLNRNSQVVNLNMDMDSRVRPPLLIDPFCKDYDEQNRVAHYYLHVASIIGSQLVSRAENARRLLIYLHETFGNGLFEIIKVNKFRDIVRQCSFYDDLGVSKNEIPNILTSINKFVRNNADGDLIEYSQEFSTPMVMVEELAQNLKSLSGSNEDKSWLYLKWMVRPYPDLRIFQHFSPRDLRFPLTRPIANVAKCLGLIDEVDSTLWKNKKEVTRVRVEFTQFARNLFPTDPTKADYPFFFLGRLFKWLDNEPMTVKTLKETLHILDQRYRKKGRTLGFDQVMSRYHSVWEKLLTDTLQEEEIHFQYEPIFNLPGNLTYTPDFLLTESTVHGKPILLEPHGKMQPKDVNKYSLFRDIYGKEYFLVLILRNEDIRHYRERGLLPETAYDDVWPFEYHDFLIGKIKQGTYEESLS